MLANLVSTMEKEQSNDPIPSLVTRFSSPNLPSSSFLVVDLGGEEGKGGVVFVEDGLSV